MLNGSISFSNRNSDINSGITNNNESSSKTYDFSPKAAYFLKERLALGLGVGISRSKSTSEQSSGSNESLSESISRGFNITPFIRYYQPIQERYGFYGQLRAGYRFIKSENEQTSRTIIDNGETLITFSESENNSDVLSLQVSPGFYYFLTKRLSFEIEASLGSVSYFNSTNTDLTNSIDAKQNGFNIDYGLSSFEFGISIFL